MAFKAVVCIYSLALTLQAGSINLVISYPSLEPVYRSVFTSGLGCPREYTDGLAFGTHFYKGRAIRHSNDWSAIILLDIRYGSVANQMKLPTWIQSSLKVSEQFGSLIKDLAQFNQRMTKPCKPID